MTLLRQGGHNLHDVIVESHIQHTVGLVQDEIVRSAEIEAAQLQVGNQASRSGDNDVGAALEAVAFVFVTFAIVASIYGHAIYIHIIRETLKGLVYLPCQFTRWSHDEAVDGIVGMGMLLQKGENGQ